ncbi:hypothetical protein [Streptomyces sp. B4I13]|nr:hypothetical protein [Streptomyces sp. B4I13]
MFRRDGEDRTLGERDTVRGQPYPGTAGVGRVVLPLDGDAGHQADA